jgi:hypothetical protein
VGLEAEGACESLKTLGNILYVRGRKNCDARWNARGQTNGLRWYGVWSLDFIMKMIAFWDLVSCMSLCLIIALMMETVPTSETSA